MQSKDDMTPKSETDVDIPNDCMKNEVKEFSKNMETTFSLELTWSIVHYRLVYIAI